MILGYFVEGTWEYLNIVKSQNVKNLFCRGGQWER